jgi:tetratricopeptide (TPR) repeat protein
MSKLRFILSTLGAGGSRCRVLVPRLASLCGVEMDLLWIDVAVAVVVITAVAGANALPYVFGQSNSAMNLYNSGNFLGAIQVLNNELATEPHNVHILLDVALSYDSAGNHSAAMVYYNKVIKEADSNIRYTTQKASALDGLGDHVDAIKFFRQGLQINPRDLFAFDGLGHSLITLRNYTGASMVFGQVLSLPIPKLELEKQPGYVEALTGRSEALMYLGHYTQALQNLDRALLLRPHDPSIYYNKGVVLQRLGDLVGAIYNYNKVLAITPNAKDALFARKLAIQSLQAKSDSIPP